MSSDKTVKIAISVILLTFIDIALTYGMECVILAACSDRSRLGDCVAMIFFAGIPAVLVQVIFAVINKRLAWFDIKEICPAIAVNMFLYAALMMLVFEHIPVAFSIIPSAEMGFGFLQMLIKIFAAAAAGICAVVSLIIMAVKIHDRK